VVVTAAPVVAADPAAADMVMLDASAGHREGTMREHLLHMPSEESHVIFLAAFLALMLFFFVFESVIEKYRPGIGH
jgi:hypothetical protein